MNGAAESAGAPDIDLFLGVDQTGAAGRRRDSAMPLHACLLRRRDRSRWRLGPVAGGARPGDLSSLTCEAVGAAIEATAGRDLLRGGASLLLAVDCVLGLPSRPGVRSASGAEALWEVMGTTHELSGFGRETARRFFDRLQRSGNYGPLRVCDRVAGAQSVFSEKPYQRNVQTGTYRIWKDLTAPGGERWCHLWPLDEPPTDESRCGWLFEGYPSLLVRDLFGRKRRGEASLGSLLSLRELAAVEVASDDARRIDRDPDLRDAAALALGALALQERARLFSPFPGFAEHAPAHTEGWIMGLNDPGPDPHPAFPDSFGPTETHPGFSPPAE